MTNRMNVKNPFDLGPSDIYDAALADPRIDSFIAVPAAPEIVMQKYAELDAGVGSMLGDPREWRRLAPDKPILMFTLGGVSRCKHVRKAHGADLSLVSPPANAARTLAASRRCDRFRTGI